MDSDRTVKELRGAIDKALNRILPTAGSPPGVLHRAMRYGVFPGGKRIRPLITLMACKAAGGNARPAMPAACAVELVHAYSLIHDDLPSMDDDDWRRGRVSCHKKFGEANAILAGDALCTLAFNILSGCRPAGAAARMVAELSDAAGSSGMVGGQAMDIQFAGKARDIKRSLLINRMKTAMLFGCSARLGAIAAGSGGKIIGAMAKYGMAFGEAFQITDDCLDGSADPRCDASGFVDEAKAALKGFGKKADALRTLADQILLRKE